MYKPAEAESLFDADLTEMTAHRDRLRDEVDDLSWVSGTLIVDLKKSRWELIDALPEVLLPVGRATTHKRYAGEVERQFNGVQYKLDDAWAIVIQLTSRENQRQEQVARIIRRF